MSQHAETTLTNSERLAELEIWLNAGIALTTGELDELRSLRAIRARRAQLEADMRAEGSPEHMIGRLATADTAAKMVDYERQIVDRITGLFGRVQS